MQIYKIIYLVQYKVVVEIRRVWPPTVGAHLFPNTG
jgi:hypothetical protein